MHIKRFEAVTMGEALRKIREEFGPEALVLSSRKATICWRLFCASRATRPRQPVTWTGRHRSLTRFVPRPALTDR